MKIEEKSEKLTNIAEIQSRVKDRIQEEKQQLNIQDKLPL